MDVPFDHWKVTSLDNLRHTNSFKLKQYRHLPLALSFGSLAFLGKFSKKILLQAQPLEILQDSQMLSLKLA